MKLTPTARFDRMFDIPFDVLENIELIAVDMDNTLAPWHSTEVDGLTKQWINDVTGLGKKVVLFTNSNKQFADEIAEKLSISVYKNAKKPFTKEAKKLLIKYGASPKTTLFIGDQLFTDIRVANGIGAKSVLLKPINDNEWWCTKVFNRSREKIVWKFVFKD